MGICQKRQVKCLHDTLYIPTVLPHVFLICRGVKYVIQNKKYIVNNGVVYTVRTQHFVTGPNDAINTIFVVYKSETKHIVLALVREFGSKFFYFIWIYMTYSNTNDPNQQWSQQQNLKVCNCL